MLPRVSSNTSGSGASSNDRAASGTSAHNELKNQKTVRIQLSRPTDEVEPTPTPGDMLGASTAAGMGVQRGGPSVNASANAGAQANAWVPAATLDGTTIGNRRRSQSWNYADNQLATSRRQSLVGNTGDAGSSSGAEGGGGGGVASTFGCSASTASASQSGAARSSRCSSSSIPGMYNASSDLMGRFTSDPGFGGRAGDSGIPVAPGLGRGPEGSLECKGSGHGGGHGDAGAGLADTGEGRRHSHGQLSGAESQLPSERRAVEERGAAAGAEWPHLAFGLGGADARDHAAGGGGGVGGGAVGSPGLEEAKDMGDLGKTMAQAPDDQEACKRNLEVIEVLGDDDGVAVIKAEDVDETAVSSAWTPLTL